jgi:hypothetical protein
MYTIDSHDDRYANSHTGVVRYRIRRRNERDGDADCHG